jgi:hypothetical protein
MMYDFRPEFDFFRACLPKSQENSSGPRGHILDCFVASGSYTSPVLASENVRGTDLIRFASPKSTDFH